MTDMVKIVLNDDYYEGASFSDYDPKYHTSDAWSVHEVPREQRDRWQAASEAYRQAQEEMSQLMQARTEQMMAERRKTNTIRHVHLRR